MREELSATSSISTLFFFSCRLFATLVLAAGVCVSRAEQHVSLAWDANTETNIVGYRLYYGTSSQSLTNSVDAGLQLTVTVTGLKEGTTYYFAVTARNADGLESDFSDQVSYTVPGVSLLVSPPTSPTDPMRVRFAAEPGFTYEILATEDFETWFTVYYTAPTVSGWVEFVDLDSYGSAQRFYRLVRHESSTVPGVSLALARPAHPGDPMRVRFEAVSGYTYEILATEDLQHWVTIHSMAATVSGWVEYADLDSSSLSGRFYRLIRH